jgi:alpha-1,2-mannosyltransferase
MAWRAPSNRTTPSLGSEPEIPGTTWANRCDTVARTHGWTWPVISAGIGAIGVTVLASVHRMIDLGTYLLGGTHAFRADLYHVVYEPTHLGFTYPPFAAILFAPLSHLPVRLDQILFSWLSLIALFGVIAVSIRVTCPSVGRRSVLWWALLLITPVGLLDPVRETLLLGQVNIFLALAVIADMTLVRPGRRGYLVGLAAAIKLTPLILIPYLLFTRQRGAWQRALAAFVGAGALSAGVASSTSWSYWTHDVWRPNAAGSLPWVGNQGMVGVLERILKHGISAPSTFVLVIAVTSVGLWIAVRAYRVSSPLLGLLVIEATESIASPVSWTHHFIWVVLLIAWLALASDRPRHGEWWAALAAVVFWAAPIWWVPHGPSVRYAGHGWSIPLADTFFIILVDVLLATEIRLIRSRGDQRRASAHASASHLLERPAET